MPSTHSNLVSELVITTKLASPLTADEDLLPRENLQSLFDRSAGKSLILITASAGYGKTTLMAQWYRHLQQQGQQVAWLMLDEDDNDPGRLYAYLHLAMENSQTQKTRLPRTNLRKVGRAQITQLSALFNQPQAPQVLFIDEFEVLKNEESIRLLWLLHQQMPADKQLIITSRRKPNWMLAKLRLQDRLLELTDKELRLSITDAEGLNQLKLGSDLSKAQAVRLIEKTEGWIAGIRLALLCYSESLDPNAWIENLNGEVKEVAEFLTEEMFDSLPAELQQFFLKTSVLNQLCAPLCEALTDKSGAQQLLERICEKGLFLQSLDPQRKWFRLHGLVRQFLLKRLMQETQNQAPVLHSTAAQWLARHNFHLEAIHHALEAGEIQLAAQLLESISQSLTEQGQVKTLIALAARIPESIISQYPLLLAGLCWSHIFLHELDLAKEMLERLRAQTTAATTSQAKLFSLELMLMVINDQAREAAEQAERNLPQLRDSDHFERGVLSNIASYGKLGWGELEASQQLQIQARAAKLEAGSYFGLAYADMLAAMREKISGRLEAAITRYQSVGQGPDYEASEDPDTVKAVSICYETELLYEQNRLDEADRLLERYFPIAAFNSPPDMVIIGYLTRARIAFAQGHFEAAYSRLEEGEVAGMRWPLPRLVHAMRWERVNFALQRGELPSAITFAQKTEVEGLPSTPDGYFHPADECNTLDIAELRLWLHTNKAEQTLERLASLLPNAIKRPLRWLKLGLFKAMAEHQLGRLEDSQHTLTQVLDSARQMKALRSLIDEGPLVLKLIQELHSQWLAQPTAVNKQRTALTEQLLTAAGVTIQDVNNRLESLTERELQVLRLVGEGLKNNQIADEIFVSVNTVKWHLRHAYEKLGVSSRTLALAEARKRQLID